MRLGGRDMTDTSESVGWDKAILSYTEWLIASGASKNTLRLRDHYLRRLAKTTDSPWSVDIDDLIGLLATPGWATETRRSARSAVRGFYRWATDTGKLTVDPSRALPAIHAPQGTPRPTPQPIVAAALARAEDRERLMILLALLAGLRRSEIAQVHTRDIVPDLIGVSVRVIGKGGKTRTIPLHPELAQAIGGRTGYLFPGKIDGHISADRVGHLLAAVLGDGWSAHTLRHRFATQAYACAHDLFAVQRLLGHSQPQTTLRYTQVADDSLRAAIRGLDEWAA
jgi:integrase/recombinase XerC